jgi:hypothetical protein
MRQPEHGCILQNASTAFMQPPTRILQQSCDPKSPVAQSICNVPTKSLFGENKQTSSNDDVDRSLSHCAQIRTPSVPLVPASYYHESTNKYQFGEDRNSSEIEAFISKHTGGSCTGLDSPFLIEHAATVFGTTVYQISRFKRLRSQSAQLLAS